MSGGERGAGSGEEWGVWTSWLVWARLVAAPSETELEIGHAEAAC